jgi:cytochrome c peroxidase
LTGRLLILSWTLATVFGAQGSRRQLEATGAKNQLALGQRLFEDKNLSADGQVSCASCHDPTRAFCDGRPVAVGVFGRHGTRNTPSLLTASRSPALTWDGRRTAMETQIRDAFLNPNELGLADENDLQRRLPSSISPDVAVAALAGFVRSLPQRRSPFDRFLAGDVAALDVAQRRGLALFEGRARCSECHNARQGDGDLTDRRFHAIDIEDSMLTAHLGELATDVTALSAEERFARIPIDANIAALGRFLVTLDPRDLGAFRTPSLRNVAQTGPYFHDGRAGTLEDAVNREIYYHGQSNHLILNPAERSDLVAFLRSLSGSEPL